MKDFLSLQEAFVLTMVNYICIHDSVHPRNNSFFFSGIYGKLDVLYAGIVAENACAENKNRSETCYEFF